MKYTIILVVAALLLVGVIVLEYDLFQASVLKFVALNALWACFGAHACLLAGVLASVAAENASPKSDRPGA